MANPAIDFAAVRFKLSLARPPCADAASELRHFGATASQTRQQIFQLCQLDLQLAFTCSGVRSKNIEDQLCAVDHARMNDFFNIALLGGGEIVIKKQQISGNRSGRASNFFQLATPD